jgi:succinyl-CoA synthetase beta subunit
MALPATWDEIARYLDSLGIATPKSRIIFPSSDVQSLVDDLNPQYVVKALPSDSDHKTELGLVALGLQNADAVATQAAAIRIRLGKPDAGVLLQEMLSGGVEVVVSVMKNKDFGSVLAIGMGGIAIELFKDIVYFALPASEEHIIAGLQKLKLWTLLQGFRGKPAADVKALITAAIRLANRFNASTDCAEIEINPLLVMPKGEGVVALDALFKKADA